MAAEKAPTSPWTSIIAIVGFIIIIAIALWGAVNAVRLAPSFFGTLASPFSKKSITITAPKEARAGEPITVSWTKAAGEGTYVFAYECKPGFFFQAARPDATFGPVPCGTPFASPGNETALRMIPTLASPGTVNVPFSISLMQQNGERLASGTTSIRIMMESGATTTPPAVVPPTSGTTTPPAQTGTPDLMTRILSIEPVYGTGISTARFEIKNVGTRPSGAWAFTANLPTFSGYTYRSPSQKSLNPGDGIVFTLRFDNAAGGTFTVKADPANAISELNEANNTASVQFLGGTSPQPYYPSY